FQHLKILQDNGILPVVFFDEVDVPQWNVYQYMLMPMWDGAFIAHGQRLEFKSSIFFFAASFQTPNPQSVKLTVLESEEEWLADAHKRLRSWLPSAPHKASDFFSRIDFYLFMPPTQYHFTAPFNQHPDIYWQDEETIQIAKYIIQSQFKQV